MPIIDSCHRSSAFSTAGGGNRRRAYLADLCALALHVERREVLAAGERDGDDVRGFRAPAVLGHVERAVDVRVIPALKAAEAAVERVEEEVDRAACNAAPSVKYTQDGRLNGRRRTSADLEQLYRLLGADETHDELKVEVWL